MKTIWPRLVTGLVSGALWMAACSTDSTTNDLPNTAGGARGDAGNGAGEAASAGVGGAPNDPADVGPPGGAPAASAGQPAGGLGGAAVDGGAGAGNTAGAANPRYGYCAKPCGVASECCPLGAKDCPGNTYPSNVACVLGACRPAECVTTQDCAATNPKMDCLENDGFSSCGFACQGDDDCQPPLTCSGVDDHGKKFCLFKAANPGCTDDKSCNGYGKCVDKLCVCESFSDCKSPIFSACAL